jgi:hypothetical protein
MSWSFKKSVRKRRIGELVPQNAEVDSVAGGVMIGYPIYPKIRLLHLWPNDLVRVQTWTGGECKILHGCSWIC